MGRSKQLSEIEKGKIQILRGQGHNWNEIGKQLQRKGETCKNIMIINKIMEIITNLGDHHHFHMGLRD